MVHYTIRRYRPRLTLVPRFLLQISYCIVYCCNNDITSTHSWFFQSPAILTSGVCSERIYCSLLSCKGLLCYCTCLTSSGYLEWYLTSASFWPCCLVRCLLVNFIFRIASLSQSAYNFMCIYVWIWLSISAKCLVTVSFLLVLVTSPHGSINNTSMSTSVNFSPEIFITN